MPKAKKGSKENPISIGEELVKLLSETKERDFSIPEASIKDDFCNYQFEVIAGVGIGDRHSVKGAGIVKDTLINAMAALNVHFAITDDVFKHGGIETDDFKTLENHEFAYLYHVTGFKIKGWDDNESIILSGTKYVSLGGRVSFDSVKISIAELSSYKWHNELKEAADKVREEVALYREGNYVPVEKDPDIEDPGQLKMSFVKGTNDHEHDDMSDFENAAVK